MISTNCGRGDSACFGCALSTTPHQLLGGLGEGNARVPPVCAGSDVREYVHVDFGSNEQQDVCEFLEQSLGKARDVEVETS